MSYFNFKFSFRDSNSIIIIELLALFGISIDFKGSSFLSG